MEEVAQVLRRLQIENGIDLEKLRDNDVFLDTLLGATQVAMRNSSETKRKALRNALQNSALPHAPDESRQQLFVHWVDISTVWHLQILAVLASPTKWFANRGRQPPQFAITSSLWQLLTLAFPELSQEQELCDLIAEDLFARGLINTQGLRTTMSGSGAMAKRATELGNQFLKFISIPAMCRQ